MGILNRLRVVAPMELGYGYDIEEVRAERGHEMNFSFCELHRDI